MMFKDKILLITGGTGSFGNALVDKLLNSDIKEIRIFSRDEKKQNDMRLKYRGIKLKFFIGDVKDIDSINNVMHDVDYVFHAAALKQVPSCEFFPIEAVKTNILGTENVLNSAINHHVKKVICLSTDKAAYPINAMGISKAMMEKVFVAKAQKVNTTTICGTRYGNVMGSRGSVIPLFIDQIKNAKPLTITEPKMTRFLMNLDEAIDLVLFAFHEGESGEIFVQKSPAATIENLAIAIQKLFNYNLNPTFLGPRHGEKMYETLMTREEMARSVEYEHYYKIVPDRRSLNYDKYFSEGNINLISAQEYNSNNTNQLSVVEIKDKLKSLDFVRAELENL